MVHNLLFTGGTLSKENHERLTNAGFQLTTAPPDLSEAGLSDALRNQEAYILGGVERVTGKVLDTAQSLKVIAFLGTDHRPFIDAEAASLRGIAVTNAPGANAQSVAEFTMGLMLDCVRKLTYLVTETKQGRWLELTAFNLAGRTLGIVGMGQIGSRVAKIARNGFDMNVVYFSRSVKDEIESEFAIRHVSLDELLTSSDVISLHLPCTELTKGIIGSDQIGRMKPDVVIVNTSPAELIEPAALKRALDEERIGAVAMDCYYIQPAPTAEDDHLGLVGMSHDRFIVTPHTAYLTRDSMDTVLEMNLKSITNLLECKGDPHVINSDFMNAATWWRIS